MQSCRPRRQRRRQKKRKKNSKLKREHLPKPLQKRRKKISEPVRPGCLIPLPLF